MHEPGVALTDYLLCLETGAFAFLLARHPAPTAARRVVALIFSCLTASSLLGGSYHGFFPGKTATSGGWALWAATMLVLGLAASLTWVLFALLCSPRLLRPVLGLAAALFAAYAFVVLRVDHRFLVSAIYSTPPILAVLSLMALRSLRGRSPQARLAAAAILLMILASILQQLHVGLDPVWFNHNALYHLLEGTAMALLFVAARRAPASAL